jgi:hypothetical protein
MNTSPNNRKKDAQLLYTMVLASSWMPSNVYGCSSALVNDITQ